jgi:hypothetical protein
MMFNNKKNMELELDLELLTGVIKLLLIFLALFFLGLYIGRKTKK